MHFASNIKHLLVEKRWNNSDLGRALNLSSQQIGRYVNGKHEPKMETLVEMARLFDVSVDDLILVDLSKESGQPFGTGVESAPTTDEQEALTIKLLMQRVNELEREMKKNDPELAKDLGIE